MSSIPKSAMPHAVAEPGGPDEGVGTRTLAGRAAGLLDTVREHPRTAIAAGALAAAGVAAAIPLARRGRKANGKANGGDTGESAAATRTPPRRAKKKG